MSKKLINAFINKVTVDIKNLENKYKKHLPSRDPEWYDYRPEFSKDCNSIIKFVKEFMSSLKD